MWKYDQYIASEIQEDVTCYEINKRDKISLYDMYKPSKLYKLIGSYVFYLQVNCSKCVVESPKDICVNLDSTTPPSKKRPRVHLVRKVFHLNLTTSYNIIRKYYMYLVRFQCFSITLAFSFFLFSVQVLSSTGNNYNASWKRIPPYQLEKGGPDHDFLL